MRLFPEFSLIQFGSLNILSKFKFVELFFSQNITKTWSKQDQNCFKKNLQLIITVYYHVIYLFFLIFFLNRAWPK